MLPWQDVEIKLLKTNTWLCVYGETDVERLATWLAGCLNRYICLYEGCHALEMSWMLK